jgi:spermidine/putrescine ABC transporter ATP-binding subunit
MSRGDFIAIRNLSKRFGSVRAVDGVDLEIGQGEFFALLGSSGCGKTTLLRLIAGFEMPNSGETLLDGQPMSDVPPNRRPVNMVFQNYAIFPHLNVRDNIAYGLRRMRLSRAERDRRVDEALALIKLQGFETRRSDQLSGGQRQRVALARALVRRPLVLLLDEPLGALDKQLRARMQIELRALQQKVGITFVFVTHDQEEALSMSDRIAVMADGRVLQVDTPTRLYERPASRAVADFIGTITVFPGAVSAFDQTDVMIDAGPVGMVTAQRVDLPIEAGQRVTVAIRPEKIRVLNEAPAERMNTVCGRV